MRVILFVVFFSFFPFVLNAQHGAWTVATFDTGSLSAVVFIDSLYGWTVGTGGNVFATTDGGGTWSEQQHVTHHNLNSVHFMNRSLGYAVGDSGTVLKTTDGGNSWSMTTSSPPADWTKVYFTSEQVGWLISPYVDEIHKTTDGGSSWIALDPPGAGGFYDLSFLDDSTGWVINGFEAYKTINGTDWYKINETALAYLYHLSFLTSKVGYIVSIPNIVSVSSIGRTTDGGVHWEWISTIDSTHVTDITFTDTAEGWTAGSKDWQGKYFGGTLNHTTDGGHSWIQEVNLDSNIMLRQVFFLDRNHGWAVGGDRFAIGPRVALRYQSTTVGAEGEFKRLPSLFQLFSNVPNPFNPITKITYHLPERSSVSLKVFNMLGQEVETLVRGIRDAGSESVEWNATNTASGVYFYRLEATSTSDPSRSFVQTRKMIMVK